MRHLPLLALLLSACAPQALSKRLISRNDETRYYARINDLQRLEIERRKTLVSEMVANPARLDRGERVRTAETIGYLEGLRGDYVIVATEQLEKDGPEAVPLLMQLLMIPGPVQTGATFHPAVVETLAAIGAPAVPLIVSELQSEAEKTVNPKLMIQGAYAALRRIGRPAVPALISIFLGNSIAPGRQDQAIFALAGMGAAPVGALDRVLRTGALGDRRAAAWALGRIARNSRQAHLPLVHALSDRAFEIRIMAAKGLGGSGAADAVPALKRALKDQDHRVRQATLNALEKIGTPEAQRIVQRYKSRRSRRNIKKIKRIKTKKRRRRKVKSRIR